MHMTDQSSTLDMRARRLTLALVFHGVIPHVHVILQKCGNSTPKARQSTHTRVELSKALTAGSAAWQQQAADAKSTLAFLLMGVMAMKLPGSDVEAVPGKLLLLLLLLRLARSRAEAPWASSSRLVLAAASPVSRGWRNCAGGETSLVLVLCAGALQETWDLDSCMFVGWEGKTVEQQTAGIHLCKPRVGRS
jgi:hypothetical protein